MIGAISDMAEGAVRRRQGGPAEMFQLFMAEPDVLPAEWFARAQHRDEAGRARVVCDYIAGMTDRFAIEEHKKLFHLDVWN